MAARPVARDTQPAAAECQASPRRRRPVERGRRETRRPVAARSVRPASAEPTSTLGMPGSHTAGGSLWISRRWRWITPEECGQRCGQRAQAAGTAGEEMVVGRELCVDWHSRPPARWGRRWGRGDGSSTARPRPFSAQERGFAAFSPPSPAPTTDTASFFSFFDKDWIRLRVRRGCGAVRPRRRARTLEAGATDDAAGDW